MYDYTTIFLVHSPEFELFPDWNKTGAGTRLLFVFLCFLWTQHTHFSKSCLIKGLSIVILTYLLDIKSSTSLLWEKAITKEVLATKYKITKYEYKSTVI